MIVTGRNWTMYNGDCTEILPLIPAGAADHVISDPPYEDEAHTKQRRTRGKADGSGTGAFEESPLDFPPITEAQRDDFGRHCVRIAPRWILAFCQAESVGTWRAAIERHGGKWKRSCVWVKPDPMPQLTGDRPGTGFESICAAYGHGKGKSVWNGGGRPGVYIFNKSRGGAVDRPGDHPTEKPLPLMLALVSDFTNAGETILDPFAGGGSTGVAAIRLGRKFIGIELNPKYFALAVERLRAEDQGISLASARSGQVPMFGGVK